MIDHTRRTYYLINCRQDCKHFCNYILISIFGALAVIIIAYVSIIGLPEDFMELNSGYKNHVMYCSGAYLIGFGMFLLAFTGDNIFGRRSSRYAKGMLHGILSIVATLFAILGVYSAYGGRKESELNSTNHTSAGWFAVYTICLPSIFGVLIYTSRGSKKTTLRVILKMVHIVTGIVAFLNGIIAICYSFQYTWKDHISFRAGYEAFYVVTLLLITTLIVIFSIFRLIFFVIFLRGRGRRRKR